MHFQFENARKRCLASFLLEAGAVGLLVAMEGKTVPWLS